MGDRSPGSASDHLSQKRSSLHNSDSQKGVRSTTKKRFTAPAVTAALVWEYLSQYGDFGDAVVSPPPGYAPLPVMRSSSFEEIDGASESDTIDQLPSLCRSQAGSRKAQTLIQRASPGDLERIVHALGPHIPHLMVDNYGNYACQTLFQTCTPAQRLSLLRHLYPHFTEVAKDNRGTHALQTFISLVNLQEEEELLISAVLPEIVEIALHPNASHVLQRLISTVKNNSPLLLPLSEQLYRLCTHQLGLLVVKMCISCAKPQDSGQLRSRLLAECIVLMQDPFGNYAVQHMLEKWSWASCREILEPVRGKVPQLSMQKFASNTVERLLELASPPDLSSLLAELADPIKLRETLGNKFAQFVLKKAITLGGESFKASLRAAISTFPPSLQAQKREKWDPILSLL